MGQNHVLLIHFQISVDIFKYLFLELNYLLEKKLQETVQREVISIFRCLSKLTSCWSMAYNEGETEKKQVLDVFCLAFLLLSHLSTALSTRYREFIQFRK